MSKVDELIDVLEMASSLRQHITGLPMIIWVSERGNAKHGPRVKVQTDYDQKVKVHKFVEISISDDPEVKGGTGLSKKDFNIIKEFIISNKTILVDLWNYKIDIFEFKDRLIKYK